MFEYVIAGIAIAVASRYINKHLPQIKGTWGEVKLSRAIKRLKLPGKVKVLRDCLFRTEWGGTSQIDALAVTRYGVIVLENKNYNCDVYGAIGEQNWRCKYPRGGTPRDPFDYTPAKAQYTQEESMYNPVKQNSTHVSVAASILKEKYPHVPFYPLVVFSDDANLYVQNSRNKVCNLKQLGSVIPRILGEEVLTDKQVEEISAILEKEQIKGRQARKNHVTNIDLGREVRDRYSNEDLQQIRNEFLRMAEDKPVLSAEGEVLPQEREAPGLYPDRPLSQIIQTAQRRGVGPEQAENPHSGPDRQHTR